MLEFDYRAFNLIECDWCLLDKNGHLAIMMSGGQGGIPKLLVELNHATTDIAFQIISNSQIVTEGSLDIDDFQFTGEHLEISKKGFYVYDATYDVLNRYTRISSPKKKLHVSKIPQRYADVFNKYRFNGVFENSFSI